MMNGAPAANEGLESHLRCAPASERVVPGGKEDDLVHDYWGGWTVFGGQRIPSMCLRALSQYEGHADANVLCRE